MALYTFFISIFVFIALNVPLFVTLSLSSILYMLVSGQSFLIQSMAPRIFAGMNSFPLLAIPLFIVTGDFLSSGKISDTLLDLANSLVGSIKGSLAIVTIVSCMFFGAVSGSAVATASAIGSVVAPEVDKMGYDKKFIAAIIAAAGPLGILIPPSIPMVLFGAVTGTSIAALLLAGIGPGVLFGLILIIYSYIYARRKNYVSQINFSFANVIDKLKKAFWALLSPVIILGGIYSGIFTPTEAAAIAAIYSLFVGMCVYRSIKLKDLHKLLLKSSITNATIMIITASIILFNWVLARERIPQLLTNTVINYIHSPLAFLFFAIIVILIAGMFIDIPAAIILLAPLFMPMVRNFGINPVYFGGLIVAGLAIGLITPPVALTLYVSSMVTGVSVNKLIKEIIPIVIIMIIGVVILIFVPDIIMFIPKALLGI